jgi:hypothetical protein
LKIGIVACLDLAAYAAKVTRSSVLSLILRDELGLLVPIREADRGIRTRSRREWPSPTPLTPPPPEVTADAARLALWLEDRADARPPEETYYVARGCGEQAVYRCRSPWGGRSCSIVPNPPPLPRPSD